MLKYMLKEFMKEFIEKLESCLPFGCSLTEWKKKWVIAILIYIAVIVINKSIIMPLIPETIEILKGNVFPLQMFFIKALAMPLGMLTVLFLYPELNLSADLITEITMKIEEKIHPDSKE